jgi:mono/diheme cytochrome c family protein
MLSAGSIALTGCSRIPGRPGPGPEVVRPDEVLDFQTLYKTNCAACHGETGKGGASLPLANPVYLASIGEDHLRQITAQGVHGTLMPPFAKSSGGSLTDKQVAVIAHGIMQWSDSATLAGQTPPPYASTLTGDADHGQQAFVASCARCHGETGAGSSAEPKNEPKNTTGKSRPGSIVDPSYLALISDQYLRSTIIAGRPGEGMPDWRTSASQPLTDQQVTDIVTWLASKRTADPGQPYRTNP